MAKYFVVLFVVISLFSLESCRIFRKKCDCPRVHSYIYKTKAKA